MVDVEAALYAVLAAAGAVTALVSTKIYPRPAPPSAALPYITYELLASPGHHHQGNPATIGSPVFQVDIWASTRSSRQAIEDAVDDAFNGYGGTAASVTIKRVFRDGRRHDYEEPSDGSPTGAYRSSLDYRVWHTETIS